MLKAGVAPLLLILIWPVEAGAQRDSRPFLLMNPKSRSAVLSIHGLRASPWETGRLGEYLNERGFTVYGMRLPGHGTRVEDLAGVTYKEWVSAALKAADSLRERSDRIYLVGVSLGGLIALYIAENRDISGVVAVAPAFKLQSRLTLFVPFVKFFKRYTWRPVRPEHREFYYERIPLSSVHELMKLSKEVQRRADRIRAPVLIMHSVKDPLVSPSGSERFYQGLKVSGKRFVRFDSPVHVLITDENPRVDEALEAIYRFLIEQERRYEGEKFSGG